MSIVSDGNHWMFISSNGGLSAGRKNSNYSLFPYYTDDKLTNLAETTGSKSIFRIAKGGETVVWEPFSIRNAGRFQYSRNIYKSVFGNKILFEEINHDLGLTYQYQWSSSNEYGFVRESFLKNESNGDLSIGLLDGIQNVLPYGVPEDLQSARSNLVDAYKRTELDSSSGLGIFALSAIIVDRAEPSEALKANIAWSLGIDQPVHLLSSKQLEPFRNGRPVSREMDVKARKGAYFLSSEVELKKGEQKEWMILADVNKGPSDLVRIINQIHEHGSGLKEKVLSDVTRGTENLIHLVSAADGFQKTSDERSNARHYSNTLYNIMRGGVFDNNYSIDKNDFTSYLKNANKTVAGNLQALLDEMPDTFTYQDLKNEAEAVDDPDFKRLAIEYLPLKFSRRHGDPSRPWNRFSINTRNETDGSKILDYEGNWRDIFQNWEALAHAYPEFIDGMIFKFLNASTADGYNPYRVTKGGFDWEIIEENDPWSYIGYWGDHQIIYLLKFLEFVQKYYPGRLDRYLDQHLFVYANVPYKIKPYESILENPKDTILFDGELDLEIRKKRERIGADGSLITNKANEPHRVNFVEKILATTLAKLSNFIPEAGIWMNTQRPEWNDANNALVGNGVSMVTLYYLHRFFRFMETIFDNQPDSASYEVSTELLNLFEAIQIVLETHQHSLSDSFSNKLRKSITDALGIAGSEYRQEVYFQSFSGIKKGITAKQLLSFSELVLKYLRHSIDANRRSDDMYHAYNLMRVDNENEISISYLDEMLEGQVAVLSSRYLNTEESLRVLDAMKSSKLFREDQYSYMLYPDKDLPPFLEKNLIPEERVHSSELLKALVENQNRQIIEKDVKGQYHFNGSFNNAESLKAALRELPSSYDEIVKKEEVLLLDIFEAVFNHRAFTGRSGTFFGYEGLGSIYWHMVSKLRLAVEECCFSAFEFEENDDITGRLIQHYYEITAGVGVHKSPELYGAFPIDAYSHTPAGKGAQQPGMTGQVKEDILSRIGELGIKVEKGCILFEPKLLRADEFLKTPTDYSFSNLYGKTRTISLTTGQLAFTLCQVPVIFQLSEEENIEIKGSDGTISHLDSLKLDHSTSNSIFGRTGEIESIIANIPRHALL